MNLKNLSANKIPRIIKDKLSNRKILNLFQLFEKSFDIKRNFIVAVSGGPDSLALAFLSKLYSLKYNLNPRYIIIDHKLRKESNHEAKKIKEILQNFSIKSKIITWRGKKPNSNIQSIARKKRYELLFNECKKFRINNLVLAHHMGDYYENFFIRLVRGSGLKGLVSLEKNTKIKNINIIRPLLEFKKEDLIFISLKIFNFFINDPSNKDTKYTRIRIRKLIEQLKKDGLNEEKLLLTIKNLRYSNQAILFYVIQNKKINSFYDKKRNQLFLNEHFFNHPHEIVFRSLSESIQFIGNTVNFSRGKKIDKIIREIKEKTLKKQTLGGCIIKKVNQTVILSKES